MKADIAAVDPVWAWRAYEPDVARPWNRRLATHLYRRFAFGGTSRQIDGAVKKPPQAAVAALVRGEGADRTEASEMDTLGRTVAANGNPESLSAWWLHRMIHTSDPALEKLTLFWHGHFATSGAKVKDAAPMLTQNVLLREHARGPFDKFVQAISRDPAMLHYLDSSTNRKVRPNENYARELMELFCLGLGNYTEKDIQQTARAFTGWEVRNGQFRFNATYHDAGEKSLFDRRGNFDGDEAARIILAQPAAARFIAAKLYRYYVADEPSPPAALIEPLAEELRHNGFQIGAIVERMAASNLFFSEHAIGRKVRGPVDLAINLVRALETTTNTKRLAQDLAQLGQAVFFPPNVKGWDGGRAWLNSSTLIGRANLVGRLVKESEGKFGGGSLTALAEKYGIKDSAAAVDWLSELLIAVSPPTSARETLVALAAKGDGDGRLDQVVHAMGALPEFHFA